MTTILRAPHVGREVARWQVRLETILLYRNDNDNRNDTRQAVKIAGLLESRRVSLNFGTFRLETIMIIDDNRNDNDNRNDKQIHFENRDW